ncbi:MAG: hypothetical protein A2104_04830 [Candidatus Melainabacteria bacterium GWF2_32_7]|nr:MAG: hypothetical protein A2104_04830 [Candidatus Melainabacteria bacterium GWF2_32_7]
MTTINPKDKQFQTTDKLFNSIVKADLSDKKIGNVFSKEELNADYEKTLKTKDPNERKTFIEKLIVADYFAGEQADKKTDGRIDKKSIFAVEDTNQKANLLKDYQETLQDMGLSRSQKTNPITSKQNTPCEITTRTIIINTDTDNPFCADSNGLDSFGMEEIRMLMESFASRNYSPAQIKDMNNEGIYTSASEMTPEMLKNITEGKVKDIQAGNYGGVKLNDDQVNNAKVIAATIVDVGKKKNQSPEQIHRAVVIALATAMQESTLKNIAYGDINQKTGKMTTSRGLFQQIKAWGSEEDRMNPVSATTMFAEKLYQTDYMNKSVTSAAQDVQQSAFPDAYAKHQPMAEALASAMLS